MKRLQTATLVIATVAVLWTLRYSQSHRGGGTGRDAVEQTPPGALERGQSVALPADPAPVTRTTGQTPPVASPGKILAIPGLPPVSLEKVTDLGWKKRIDAIIGRADFSETLKAKSLMEMLPSLPEQATAEAAQEAATRVPDADYRATILSTLVDPKTDNRVIAVLFADLMERPASISLPVLLVIAKDSTHSYAPFALQNLAQMLGGNLGSDWAKWEVAIQNHLAILRK